MPSSPPGDLTVIANTGDDIERHGLLVMPDHDAILYMLGDRFDHERGWGIAGETWTVMEGLKAYGEEGWFGLGDRDFATHIARTSRIRAGATVTEAVLALQAAVGLATRVLPMTDASVRTQVRTDDGWLDFQEYFVHRHQGPEVHEVRFEGIEAARPTEAVSTRSGEADLIVIGPSNPIVSLGSDPRRPGDGRGDRRQPGSGRPGDDGQRHHRRQGAQGAGGSDARVARSRGERRRAWPAILAPHTDTFVLDMRGCDARTSHRAPRPSGTHVTDTIMADAAGRARLAADLLAFAGCRRCRMSDRAPASRGHRPGRRDRRRQDPTRRDARCGGAPRPRRAGCSRGRSTAVDDATTHRRRPRRQPRPRCPRDRRRRRRPDAPTTHDGTQRRGP